MTAQTADVDKVWTTVGSAGSLHETSVGKVFFDHGIVQMGTVVGDPIPTAQCAVIPQGTHSVVIHYNVTPVDGLFTPKARPCSSFDFKRKAYYIEATLPQEFKSLRRFFHMRQRWSAYGITR